MGKLHLKLEEIIKFWWHIPCKRLSIEIINILDATFSKEFNGNLHFDVGDDLQGYF